MADIAVRSTQRPGAGNSADRIVLAGNAVAVLDGASSYDDNAYGDTHGPTAVRYVDLLAQLLHSRLQDTPRDRLSTVVAAAIRRCADELDVVPGNRGSPSSTVSIARFGDTAVDVFVLGDSPVILGRHDGVQVIVDHRLSELALPELHTYTQRLRDGHGFDRGHRDLLTRLQHHQQTHRNRPDGYWIAEADPQAAYHAVTATVPPSELSWLILATDGAADTLASLGMPWPEVAGMNSDRMAALLDRCHRWERDVDPSGIRQPRAKRHDDKTLVVVRER